MNSLLKESLKSSYVHIPIIQSVSFQNLLIHSQTYVGSNEVHLQWVERLHRLWT